MAKNKKPATLGSIVQVLFDRVAMAFVSAVTSLVAGALVWLIILRVRGPYGIVPFEPVLWFAGIMACLGFIFAEDLLVKILSTIWDAIYSFKP